MIAIDPAGIVMFGGKPANFLLLERRPDGVLDFVSTSKYRLVIQSDAICVGQFQFKMQDIHSVSTRLLKNVKYVVLAVPGEKTATKEVFLALYEIGFNYERQNQKMDNLAGLLQDRVGKQREATSKAQVNQHLDRLKKLVQVSKSLKVSQMAQILDLSEKELYQRIVDWAAEFGFTLDQDVVDFSSGKKDTFLAALDKEFATWGKQAGGKT